MLVYIIENYYIYREVMEQVVLKGKAVTDVIGASVAVNVTKSMVVESLPAVDFWQSVRYRQAAAGYCLEFDQWPRELDQLRLLNDENP
jgi:hypothetical protein